MEQNLSEGIVNVLIVAKCIVNQKALKRYEARKKVLIVAKCIVNGLPLYSNHSFISY